MLIENSTTAYIPPIVLDAPRIVKQKQYSSPNMAESEAKEMLSYLDPDSEYLAWLKIGMALHAGGYSCDLWDNWSQNGQKYQQGICQEKWATFNGDNGVTMGTLIHMAKQQGYNGESSQSGDLNILSPADLQDKPIPPRLWVIKDYLPINSTTALYGDGGTGKSLLAMQAMTCVALGRPWLGQEVMPVKTFGFFCEDTPDELHRRQVNINHELKCQFSDLSNMRWYSGVGEDNTLVDYNITRKACLTELYKKLERQILEFEARFIVIDTAADTFGGNENARGEVRNFVGSLNKLALSVNGAVLLCAHPSVAGMASGRGDGGNTAWNNTVRSRLYLSRPDKEEAETDKRVLSRKKSNYAKAGEGLELFWKNGVFTMQEENPSDAAGKIHKQQYAENHFLSAIDEYVKAGRNLSVGKTSGNYAPKAIKRTTGCPSDLSVRELEAAMESLFSKNLIKNVEYGRAGAKKIERV